MERIGIPKVAKEDEDAVIRVTSYERKVEGRPFIRFDAPRFSFIREALRTPFASAPEADLGAMKNLPVEVLWRIFRPLDMATLIHLRQVNRRARQVVTAMKEYHTVIKYAIHVVLALDRVAMLGDYAFAEFDDAMRYYSCTRCGQFGGYVILRWLNRICSRCMVREVHSIGHEYQQQQPPPEWLKVADEADLLAAPLPYIRSDTKGQPPCLDHGIYCVGCYIALGNTPGIRRRKTLSYFGTHLQNCAYSREGFLDHFVWCPESNALWEASQGVWEASQGGRVPVEVPEFVRKWRVDNAAVAE
jgi:hypothetical protein